MRRRSQRKVVVAVPLRFPITVSSTGCPEPSLAGLKHTGRYSSLSHSNVISDNLFTISSLPCKIYYSSSSVLITPTFLPNSKYIYISCPNTFHILLQIIYSYKLYYLVIGAGNLDLLRPIFDIIRIPWFQMKAIMKCTSSSSSGEVNKCVAHTFLCPEMLAIISTFIYKKLKNLNYV